MKEYFDTKRAVKSAVGYHIIENQHTIKEDSIRLLKHISKVSELDAYEYMRKFSYNLMNTLDAPIQSPLFVLTT